MSNTQSLLSWFNLLHNKHIHGGDLSISITFLKTGLGLFLLFLTTHSIKVCKMKWHKVFFKWKFCKNCKINSKSFKFLYSAQSQICRFYIYTKLFYHHQQQQLKKESKKKKWTWKGSHSAIIPIFTMYKSIHLLYKNC